MKKLIFIVLLLISNISFAQQQDSIKPINSLSVGAGINYNNNIQLGINLIVHNAYVGYTTDVTDNLRTMEIGYSFQHKNFKNWYLVPTLGVYSNNNYSYSVLYIQGVPNTNVNGIINLGAGNSNYSSFNDQTFLITRMSQLNKEHTLKPCYGVMMGYHKDDITYYLKVNNKQISIGVGYFIF